MVRYGGVRDGKQNGSVHAALMFPLPHPLKLWGLLESRDGSLPYGRAFQFFVSRLRFIVELIECMGMRTNIYRQNLDSKSPQSEGLDSPLSTCTESGQ